MVYERLRPDNYCLHCANQWIPRGKNLCPRCKSMIIIQESDYSRWPFLWTLSMLSSVATLVFQAYALILILCTTFLIHCKVLIKYENQEKHEILYRLWQSLLRRGLTRYQRYS